MKNGKIWLIVVALGCLLLLIAQNQIGATSADKSYYVAIPAGAISEATGLGLNPRLALDYGSYHWLELNKTDFDLLAKSGVAYEYNAEAGTVQITQYRFDPLTDGEPALPAYLRNESGTAGLRLVQMVGPTNDAWLTQLEATGLKVLQYYPHYAFLVWGNGPQAEAAEALPFVRWQGAVQPGYKMNQDLVGVSGRVQNVDIFFYNDGNIEATLDAIVALGGTIVQYYPAQPDKAFYDAIVQFDAERFVNLAQLESVLWFGYSSPVPQLDDEMSAQIIAGNYSGAGVPFVGYEDHLAELGVDGSGVIWATIDTGVDYDHPDLGSHIVGGYNFPGACVIAGQPGTDCPAGGHGTHVTGIIGGDATGGFMDGNGFLYGLGVAPNYSIFAMNSLSAAAWPPAGGWQEHSKRAVLGNAVGGNNSWTTGEGTAHGYQASERTHDIMVLDGNFDTASVAEPFIEVFSAGNSGPGAMTLTSPKEGKNLIIVASSRNYRVGSIDAISSFSSRGPAVDGRYGITIATPGEQIASSRNDTGGSCSTAIGGTNNLYAYCSGTSMAAPHASGSIVLITEWWRGFNAGANPTSAMAKALLVNGAVDMGTADIPNTNEGWGRVNITHVISPSVPVLYFETPMIFDNSGEQWTLDVSVADTSKPLKVTVAWADAPGSVGANPALVNNLNLTVVNGANTYLGNVFSGGWSNTGGTADNRNNIENVYVQAPAGTATITLTAANISGDAILYSGDTTDQGFALICWNCQEATLYAANLSGGGTQDGLPGTTVTHNFVLENTGADDSYNLAVSGNNWTTTVAPNIAVSGGTTATIPVEVQIPYLETLHGSDTFTLTVTSVGDPNLMLTDTATTNSVTTSGIQTSGDQSASGAYGQMIMYEVTITNTADYTDTIDVAVAGSPAWTTTPAGGSVGPLAPNASATVMIHVVVGAGSADVAEISFTSQLDPAVTTSVFLNSSTYLLYLPVVVGEP